MSKVFDLYKEIGGAFGPSGREDAVREAIAAVAGAYIDEITTDALGNLICRKKGTGKKLLFAAHMDSIGLVATFIDEKGFVRFSQVGGLFHGDLIHTRVRFANGTRGVISYEEKTPFKSLGMDNLFLDIGAKSRAEAEQLIEVGDFAVFDAPCFEQNGVICGPYLDNRIGCVTLLLLLEQLGQETPENDLYFVFTAQEEVGLRGAGAAAFAVEPDAAVAVDVTDTGDLPERKTPMAVKLGGGPAVKVMDRSVICTPALRVALELAAADCGIHTQREILQFGGTDTAALQKARAGVPAGAVSIPTRYIHSPSELCAVSDVEQTAQLLARFASKALNI
ncbi:MAG: M20/M25/M40 family metallo-hydrolase [Agathobaculum sp.]|uniref:M42 family metallopeptidase n=1 Tax=Agathobaculum sp. TaxID=2048138 RepID=UPI0025C49D3C|nr:M20/M25/M40 family metallo-hydrolase [Agathobaculum sp.]MCI7124957.1 M20/M25/M40 family metallo-hydrolase [Agathobaculum sp.]